MKTLSAVLTKPKKFELVELDLPDLKKDQVLLKVISCGICSTEHDAYNGKLIGSPGVSFRYKKYPALLGHEVVGHVIEVGSDVNQFKIGDCVTGLTYSGCGFSEHFIENADMLVKIDISDLKQQIVSLGEPLMATCNIINQIGVNSGDTIVIIGDGYMSQLLLSGLSRHPLKHLVVVGHHDSRLEMALKFGATSVINSKNSDAWKKLMELTNNVGFDVSIEYAGNADSLRLAASVCKAKKRAKLVLAASYSEKMEFSIANYLQNRAPIIIPGYPNQSDNKIRDLEQGMLGLQKGIFPMEKLITHRYKLEDIQQGFEDSINRTDGYIKGIITPN